LRRGSRLDGIGIKGSAHALGRHLMPIPPRLLPWRNGLKQLSEHTRDAIQDRAGGA